MKAAFFILAVLGLATLSGCGCSQQAGPQYRVSLEVWGFGDDSYTFDKIFENYKKLNPTVTRISYKKLTVDTYKKELIDALASGQGPDIFLIHNDWLPSFSDKITPAPVEILNEQKFRQDFPDVVSFDFLDQGKAWAVPLSVDSLALYYNKDLFNAAGIATPPKDWDQFVDDVSKLTEVDSTGEIIRSGAALGTAYNINRSTDILNLLMFQNGTEIADSNGSIVLGQGKRVNGETTVPAENALSFYDSFAKSGSSHYTWNKNMHYSIDAFSEGQVAMMFNYSWNIKTIENKAPKLNFAVAPVPQFKGSLPANYANYWGYAVAKNKTINTDPSANNSNSANVTDDIRVAEAWRLLAFLTTKSSTSIQTQSTVGQASVTNYDPAAEYLKATGNPAARRDLIETQKTDPNIGVFATDNLIAKSWKKTDPEAAEAMFAETVDQVNLGKVTANEAIATLSRRIAQLMTK